MRNRLAYALLSAAAALTDVAGKLDRVAELLAPETEPQIVEPSSNGHVVSTGTTEPRIYRVEL